MRLTFEFRYGMYHRHRSFRRRRHVNLLEICSAIGAQVFDDCCVKTFGDFEERRSGGFASLVRIFKQRPISHTHFFATEAPSLCNSFFTMPQFVLLFKRWTFSPPSSWYKHRIDPLDICEPKWTIHFIILISWSGDRMAVVSIVPVKYFELVQSWGLRIEISSCKNCVCWCLS